MLSQEYLRSVFVYEPCTGVVFWREDRIKVKKGARAGCKGKRGYRQIWIAGKRYKEHVLIWCMVTGNWPKEDLDHKNGIRDDNRFLNLREASRSQNNANAKVRSDNPYGIRGITWLPERKKWKARIQFNGVVKNLGYFVEKEDAISAYQKHAVIIFGEFVRHWERKDK
jgi:hypothetical protein